MEAGEGSRAVSRWRLALVTAVSSAVTATVAIVLSLGGFPVARATAPSEAAAFVPIAPCRLFDTRPESRVGPRSVPLGPDDTHTVRATGQQGDCDLPEDIRGLALNITAVDATQLTFLTVFPAGAERPTASALNPAPGQPPTPNAVTTDLNDGQFSIFNRFGSVHVIGDVVGYYTDHHHDDRYYTRAEVEALLDELAADLRGELTPTVHVFHYSDQFMWSSHPAGKAGVLGTFEKLHDDTVVEVIWSSQGLVRGDLGACSWSIRIDGRPDDASASGVRPSDAITEAKSVVPLKVIDVFHDLPAGTHTVELWMRSSHGALCLDNAGVYRPQVIVKEYRADRLAP